MTAAIDVSVVGEKFGKPIEIPYVGFYLIEPEFNNYQEIANFDKLSEKEKLYEMGGNISLKISFECNEKVTTLETQKIYSGVISGFGVPSDIPRGQCKNLSIYVLESDPSFSERRGDLNIVIKRLTK